MGWWEDYRAAEKVTEACHLLNQTAQAIQARDPDTATGLFLRGGADATYAAKLDNGYDSFAADYTNFEKGISDPTGQSDVSGIMAVSGLKTTCAYEKVPLNAGGLSTNSITPGT